MNRKEFDRRVTNVMRENGIRKHISAKKQVFHISDDNGNKEDFVIQNPSRDAIFTIDDVRSVIDICLYVVMESLQRGESVTFHGFGSLGVHHRKARATKIPGTDERIEVEERYVPKFTFGNHLRMCARNYALSLDGKNSDGIASMENLPEEMQFEDFMAYITQQHIERRIQDEGDN